DRAESQTVDSDAPTFATCQTQDIPTTWKENRTDSGTGPSSLNDSAVSSVSLLEISPLPVMLSNNNKRKRKTQTANLLTTSPYIEELKEKHVQKQLRERKQQERKAAKAVKKKIFFDNDSEHNLNNSENDDDEEDVACIYCNEVYSHS